MGIPSIAVGDDRGVRIFISSVRRGLEFERDSLPGLDLGARTTLVAATHRT